MLPLGSAPAAPRQQFDLLCSGQERFALLDPYRPANIHLRVDLASRKWCEEPPPGIDVTPCAVLRPIADIQPGLLILETESPEEKASGVTRTRTVNRETGEYMHYVHDRKPGVIDVRATCEPAPFSGFPEIETKF